MKHDEFFGNVETYRGDVAVRLPLEGAQAGGHGHRQGGIARLRGCRRLLSAAGAARDRGAARSQGARPGEPVSATPAKKSWFN